MAEDQEQVDKILVAQASSCRALRLVIYDDPRGHAAYQPDWLKSFDDVRGARPQARRRSTPGAFEAEIDRGPAGRRAP